MRTLAGTLIFLLAIYNAFSDSSDITKAFNDFMIVPTTVPTAPSLLLSVRFGVNVVKLGNYIDPHEAAYPPVMWFQADPTGLYCLLILDLYKPNLLAPNTHPYVFLLVVNIPGNKILDGDIVSPYVPPSPIPGTGYHHYVYLVFRQSSRIDTNAEQLVVLPGDFTNFSLPLFTKEFNLSNPIAGNFFTTRASICYDQPPQKLEQCTL